MIRTRHGAIVALALLVPAAIAFGDTEWRNEVRERMRPSKDITDELDSRGIVLSDWIGIRYVDITWDALNDELGLSVEGNPVADFEQWIDEEAPGQPVIDFVAYEGSGTFGPDEDMGLRGWVYLDDFGDVRLDLMVGLKAITYRVSQQATIGYESALECKCDSGNQDGCTDDHCTQSMKCPDMTSMRCGWQNASVVDFEVEFQILTQE